MHKSASDSEIHFKWKTVVEDKREALMEDKSECINKHDIIAWIKQQAESGCNRSLPIRGAPLVIDQVFPSAWQIAVITERIKLFIKNNKLSIMYGRNRQGTDVPE